MTQFILRENIDQRKRSEAWVSLDIVIPVFNEEEVLDLLFQSLERVFSSENLNTYRIKAVHYVIVDDGSSDRTASIISNRIANGIPATLYRFSRNFGHQNAITAGLDNADADLVAIIDADLQDPPEIIFEMIAKWRQGFDIVYGQREKRKESRFKVFCYWAFYHLLAFLSEIETPLDSGDFCIIDHRVVMAVRDLPEKIRFPRGLRSWVGFRHTGVSYHRPKRKAGNSKYSFVKLYKLATDGIASMSIRPLRISQLTCVVFLLLTGTFIVYALKKYLSYSPEDALSLWFVFGYILMSSGFFILCLCIYIMSSYTGRMYLEIKGRPSYLVMEVFSRDGFSSKKDAEKPEKNNLG